MHRRRFLGLLAAAMVVPAEILRVPVEVAVAEDDPDATTYFIDPAVFGEVRLYINGRDCGPLPLDQEQFERNVRKGLLEEDIWYARGVGTTEQTP